MVNSQSKSSSQPAESQNAVVNSTLTAKQEVDWTIEDSANLYNIKGWGEPYFGINDLGNVTVSVPSYPDHSIDLAELVKSLNRQNIDAPLLIRFPDILGDRMARLQECMDKAIARYSYPGQYQGVFPIKCNQQRHFLEDLVNYGKQHDFGLEAGSKAELIIALASFEHSEANQSLLMCNGYKDREYIETALLATKIGQKPIIIIEQLPELALTLAISKELEIKPILGVRVKLDSKGTGRWGNSSGDRAKFGLTITEIMEVIQCLKSLDYLDYLQLLHFHIGSQISAIGVVKDAIREASQVYVQLVRLGANIQYLNVGGGLAVDYDGSKTNFAASKNYNMQNYANDIIAQVKDACQIAKIAAPTLVSESGRAITAHQSVLIFDVLSTSNIPTVDICVAKNDAPLILRNFWETYQSIDETNLQESYNDAIQFKKEALSLFNFGYLSLSDRAEVEQLYWSCCSKITKIIDNQAEIPEDLANLAQVMAITYHVNLSIFRSAPDTWAIDQLFPIMPIQRLDQKPTVKGILADITCDSDGKVDRFINRKDAKKILELHPLANDTSPYYLGLFLVGAYQEIMGNFHNLFGGTNVVHIKITASGYQLDNVILGDSIKEVLSYVKYNNKAAIVSQSLNPPLAARDVFTTCTTYVGRHNCTLLLSNLPHTSLEKVLTAMKSSMSMLGTKKMLRIS